MAAYKIISTGKRGETNGNIQKNGHAHWCGEHIDLSAREVSLLPRCIKIQAVMAAAAPPLIQVEVIEDENGIVSSAVVVVVRKKWWRWLLPWKWMAAIRAILSAVVVVFAIGCAREYQNCGQIALQTTNGVLNYAANEVVATSTTHAVTTGTFGPGYVRIVCTGYTYFVTGAAPEATTTHPVSGTQPFFVYLPEAVKFSFELTASTGNCSVTPMSSQ